MIVHLSLIAILVVATTGLAAEPAQGPPAVATPLLTQALPDLKGKEVTMVTVEYPPGGESNAHRHNANTFVYVLEGSVVMQVRSGPEVTLHAGDTFYESPTDIHVVSRNASNAQSAKFLVFFVKDQGASTMAPAAAE
jgi:quercetin dioxygenase-like cupin family protein